MLDYPCFCGHAYEWHDNMSHCRYEDCTCHEFDNNFDPNPRPRVKSRADDSLSLKRGRRKP